MSWALENGGRAPKEEGHSLQREKHTPTLGKSVLGQDVPRDCTAGSWETRGCRCFWEAGGVTNGPLDNINVGTPALPRNSKSLVMGLALGICISNTLPWAVRC